MYVKIYDIQYDNVIKSFYLTTGVDYEYALDELVPLINKLDFQRNTLRASFYKRLENDIQTGCIMPNITVAIKVEGEFPKEEEITVKYLEDNMKNAFILDGIQRLNTLSRIDRDKLDLKRVLYCNILISDSMDRLLYRMILSVTEKEKKSKKKIDEDTMNKESLIKGYLAYVSNSINIDNQKIIEEKMNELIADKILNSNIASKNGEFQDVVDYISKMMENEYLNGWFKVVNNFIGFAAAMNISYVVIQNLNSIELQEHVQLFEEVFSAIDVSKIKLGMARRRMVKFYFENYNKFSKYGFSDLLDVVSQEL